jgi:hypothetical protein
MRRNLLATLAFVTLALGVGPVRMRPADLHAMVVVPKGAEEVWELEGKRRAAVLAGDLKTLDALSADEMTYSHTNGKVDTKKTYLEALRSGVRYEQLELSDVSIARYDGTVVIVGVAQIAVKSPRGPIAFRARFTDVWARQQDRWRFVAWHTTLIPEP